MAGGSQSCRWDVIIGDVFVRLYLLWWCPFCFQHFWWNLLHLTYGKMVKRASWNQTAAFAVTYRSKFRKNVEKLHIINITDIFVVFKCMYKDISTYSLTQTFHLKPFSFYGIIKCCRDVLEGWRANTNVCSIRSGLHVEIVLFFPSHLEKSLRDQQNNKRL